MLASTLPYSQSDFCGFALEEADVHVDMADVLCQDASGTSDGDEAGLDGDFNALRDVEFFGLEYVPHL